MYKGSGVLAELNVRTGCGLLSDILGLSRNVSRGVIISRVTRTDTCKNTGAALQVLPVSKHDSTSGLVRTPLTKLGMTPAHPIHSRSLGHSHLRLSHPPFPRCLPSSSPRHLRQIRQTKASGQGPPRHSSRLCL
jgi:hypothetical protein